NDDSSVLAVPRLLPKRWWLVNERKVLHRFAATHVRQRLLCLTRENVSHHALRFWSRQWNRLPMLDMTERVPRRFYRVRLRPKILMCFYATISKIWESSSRSASDSNSLAFYRGLTSGNCAQGTLGRGL